MESWNAPSIDLDLMYAFTSGRLLDFGPIGSKAVRPLLEWSLQAIRPPSPNGANGEMDEAAPSANGDYGHDSLGRFAMGNKGVPGNPFARRVGRLRRRLPTAHLTRPVLAAQSEARARLATSERPAPVERRRRTA